MHLSTLSQWLDWIASLHNTEIELGLERVKTIGAKLGVLGFDWPIVIVGGTNGKGSTVAGLEAIYLAQGYQVGAFTSPVIFTHHEQVRINGCLLNDDAFCFAFQKVAQALGDTTLTPFEFHTLAALVIFKTYPLDVLLLEVGLGGRLDATNLVEPDISVVTSIGIDHVDYLGDTREKIAWEKAGIFRPGKPAVCGEAHPPFTLIDYADAIGAKLYIRDKDFFYTKEKEDWTFSCPDKTYTHLPFNQLYLQNMATVLMVIHLLQKRLPVEQDAMVKGLSNIQLIGRVQIFPGEVTEIYDVSHNIDSITLLATRLQELPCGGKTYGVFSMLADKAISESVRIIAPHIAEWYIAPLSGKRAASAEVLSYALQQAGVTQFTMYETIETAYEAAKRAAKSGDRIIIFGSFHTVAAALAKRNPRELASTLCTRK